MFAIRNIAARKGNVPNGLLEQAKNLLSTCRVVPLTNLSIEKRKKLGLPSIKSASPEIIRKLVKGTMLSKFV
jgi:heterodisulfide reductase subunit C